MKQINRFVSVILLFLLISLPVSFGQERHSNHGHRNRNQVRIVVKRSQYRPARVRRFKPNWAHNHYYQRRWVYFPGYNFYWDNWRGQYVYFENNIWTSYPGPPPALININIENEKHYELKKKDDDVDDIYNGNAHHNEIYIKK
jgi:hypothetical protein